MLDEDYTELFDETGKMSMSFIKSASERMKFLVDGLLDYSRLGKEVAYKDIDCNRMLIELQHDLDHAIQRTNAVISVQEMPIIKGSEYEIRMVFQNLVSNAIKFVATGVNPKITISCEKEVADDTHGKTYWKFAISDNGIGIPEIYHERIFSIFQRLHSRELYEGTGIGLAHCKKIIESHGGNIWLESEEGRGTTFFFTIPA